MRPSSSPSEPGQCFGLFDGVLAAGPACRQVTDGAWLQALLDVEAGLARAQARLGRVAPAVAAEITAACQAERFDIAHLSVAASASGNPVVPLVRALRAGLPPAVARHVHQGATSQDILDSAAMLLAHRASGGLLADLAATAELAAALADGHRHTLVAGRTLLQQALPTTFGLVAAGWLTALDAAGRRLTEVRRERLAVQLGGAVGTLAALGAGPELLGAFADELGLAEPVLPWHTDRTRLAELAGALGGVAGTVAKVARDITLLAQTEVGEVREGGDGGGSSTMPHKHNPIAAISAAGSAAQAPGLVSTLLATMAQEHQRAAGGWHAEWPALTALLRTVGSALWWLRACLDGLIVDTERMRANLELTGGALLAERISGALATSLGRSEAHELVGAATTRATGSGRPLIEVLTEDPRISAHLDRAALAELLDPATYVGSAAALIDRALRAHASSASARTDHGMEGSA